MSREKSMVLEEILNQFKAYLLERENSPATIHPSLTVEKKNECHNP